ncbi:hypothetical protein [Brachyspira hyodysenteriae]|uniref:hypothetical protein n=1 Tax=Brachyspira hyodysenteriae TaxID=159 RepID=UPI00063DB0EE|nr:hypothetical protein [Brachyspira hyodysenteriae]KLI54246.1 hypothetical protein SZ43_04380 [Brachyspira hyodysenteriae]MCZ9850191.1 hypothetical protein [Brachyspira hyodysenteriae]MCZ9878161.1 hypothetical protein [Brachyspira hyodysenteriae]MCZ9889666.1 hypothetical protein [Brachyspira hyodysenteriae]MCZ9894610.1 hypothetical protein [Brachyspira hyodysenteriae]
MGKTITKEIYSCENCLFAKDHTCMLSKCIRSSLPKIKTKQNKKHKPFISNKKHIRKNARSFLYQISKETFYKLGYSCPNIKEAAQKLGTSEANLKWFLYSYMSNNNEKKEERIERICAFLDGQNDSKKDKLKARND